MSKKHGSAIVKAAGYLATFNHQLFAALEKTNISEERLYELLKAEDGEFIAKIVAVFVDAAPPSSDPPTPSAIHTDARSEQQESRHGSDHDPSGHRSTDSGLTPTRNRLAGLRQARRAHRRGGDSFAGHAFRLRLAQ